MNGTDMIERELRDRNAAKQRQITVLEVERDAILGRLRTVEKERDAALDVIEAVRSIALGQSTTLWSKKILAALAQQLVAGVE